MDRNGRKRVGVEGQRQRKRERLFFLTVDRPNDCESWSRWRWLLRSVESGGSVPVVKKKHVSKENMDMHEQQRNSATTTAAAAMCVGGHNKPESNEPRNREGKKTVLTDNCHSSTPLGKCVCVCMYVTPEVTLCRQVGPAK